MINQPTIMCRISGFVFHFCIRLQIAMSTRVPQRTEEHKVLCECLCFVLVCCYGKFITQPLSDWCRHSLWDNIRLFAASLAQTCCTLRHNMHPRITHSSRWRSCWSWSPTNSGRMSSCHSSSQAAHHPRLCHWEQPLLNGKKQFIIVSYSLFFLSFVCRLVDYIISSF